MSEIKKLPKAVPTNKVALMRPYYVLGQKKPYQKIFYNPQEVEKFSGKVFDFSPEGLEAAKKAK